MISFQDWIANPVGLGTFMVNPGVPENPISAK